MSSILECSAKFYKFLLENSRTFEKVQAILFFLDSSICIIEQYTNLKYIKHQEKQITLKKYIYVIKVVICGKYKNLNKIIKI